MDLLLKIVATALVALPTAAIASDCHIVEYPDHYEAVCVGHESPVSVQETSGTLTNKTAVTASPPGAPQGTLSPAAKSPAPPPSDAVKSLMDYRQRESQKSTRDAAKASRMRLIQEGRMKQTGSLPVLNGTGLKP